MYDDAISRQILARRPWLRDVELVAGFTASSVEASSNEVEIGERLIAAYEKATAGSSSDSRSRDMWSIIFEASAAELIDLLSRRNPRALTDYLRALPRQRAAHGFFQGRNGFDKLSNSLVECRRRALWFTDHLNSMAESLGVLAVRCPEQDGWDDYAGPASLKIADLIERGSGLSVSLPQIFEGLFVLEPDDRPIHMRSIIAAYTLYQLKQLLHVYVAVEPPSARIAEIGGGVGLTALAARHCGIGKYSIYDLPYVNVAQGYFLLRSLRSDSVVLYGEKDNDAPVKVLPDHAFYSAQEKSFDVVLNVDSFPEIATSAVVSYLKHMKQHAKYLLSINQENKAPQTVENPQLCVRSVVDQVGGFTQILRHPNWIRTGYLDEIWQADSGSSFQSA